MKWLLVGILILSLKANETFGYYDFDTKVDKVKRIYNEKNKIEKLSIFLTSKQKSYSFIAEPQYEDEKKSSVAVYSGMPGEVIVEESCCGYDRRYYLNYYIYNKVYNDFILYKHIESNGIFIEDKEGIRLLDDTDITISYPKNYIGLNGTKYQKIKLNTPNKEDATRELKRIYNKFKNKEKIYTVTNIFYFYSLLYLYPLQIENKDYYNNIAYYLQKAGANEEAIFLLKKIIKKFPNRTVAYYNLGDAYWELGEKKKAINAYTTYIEQMCHKGLQKKIPKVVLERVTNKR